MGLVLGDLIFQKCVVLHFFGSEFEDFGIFGLGLGKNDLKMV